MPYNDAHPDPHRRDTPAKPTGNSPDPCDTDRTNEFARALTGQRKLPKELATYP
jgi:hypothetical protein